MISEDCGRAVSLMLRRFHIPDFDCNDYTHLNAWTLMPTSMLSSYLLAPQAQGRGKPFCSETAECELSRLSCKCRSILFPSQIATFVTCLACRFMETLFESIGLPVLAGVLATAPACLASSPNKASVLSGCLRFAQAYTFSTTD